MTPKEKAIELVDKFTIPYYEWDGDGYNINWDETFKNRKQCALIAVYEMINILIMVFDNDDTKIESYDFMDKRIKYLEEVKTEIEKL
jgi:hypothetical protein